MGSHHVSVTLNSARWGPATAMTSASNGDTWRVDQFYSGLMGSCCSTDLSLQRGPIAVRWCSLFSAVGRDPVPARTSCVTSRAHPPTQACSYGSLHSTKCVLRLCQWLQPGCNWLLQSGKGSSSPCLQWVRVIVEGLGLRFMWALVSLSPTR